MKRGAKVCCRDSGARAPQARAASALQQPSTARRLARRVRAALLVALACWLLPAYAQIALHVTAAQMQVQTGGTFGPRPPLPALDSAAWEDTPLPAVLARSVIPPAGDDPVDIAWFRIELPDGAARVERGALRLYIPRWQTIGQVTVYADSRLVYESDAGPVWNGSTIRCGCISMPRTARGQRAF